MRQVAKCECARRPNSLRPNTRVIIGFLVVYMAYILGDFEHIIIATLLIQYSMPIATTSYLFAFKFNGPDKEVAVMTASSTVTILFLLPVIIYLVK